MGAIPVILVETGDDGQFRAALAGPHERLVALYRPPWDALFGPTGRRSAGSGGTPATLDAWTRRHAEALQAWRAASGRIVLVNVAGLAGADEAAGRLATLGLQLAPEQFPATDWTTAPAWARALAAACIAEFAPRAMECYDALEGCAQVPAGEGADHGGAGAAGPEFDAMLDHVGEALGALAALQRERDELAEAARGAADADELDALRRKNELLAFQLEQLHEEVAQGESRAVEAARFAQRAAELGTRARMLLSRLARTR